MISGQINILPRVIGSSQKPCLHCLALATIQSWDSWKGQQVCGLARNRVVDKSVSFHLKLVLNPRWRNLQHISILSYASCQDLKSIVLHFSPDSYHRMLLTMEHLVFCLAIWSNFIFRFVIRWQGDRHLETHQFEHSDSQVFEEVPAPYFFYPWHLFFFGESNRENPRLISIFTISQEIVTSVTSLYFSLAFKIINFILKTNSSYSSKEFSTCWTLKNLAIFVLAFLLDQLICMVTGEWSASQ